MNAPIRNARTLAGKLETERLAIEVEGMRIDWDRAKLVTVSAIRPVRARSDSSAPGTAHPPEREE